MMRLPFPAHHVRLGALLCALGFATFAPHQARAQAAAQASTQARPQANTQANTQASPGSGARARAPAASSAISPAETLLFETDHLARVKAPAVLVYDFRKVSNVEPGFSDKVQLDLADDKGKTSATLHFLSGTHRHDIPALQDAHGNPVLLGFLERDIAEMKRLTGGSAGYFRKRIRMALADEAQVGTQRISYQGRSLPAQVVRIQPYLNDPLHARFEQYVHKTYTFIVSDQVPGGVYQLRSSLSNEAGTAVARAAVARKGEAQTRDARTGAAGAATAGAAASAVATPGSPAAGAAAKGASPGAALPAIDETLTLVSVTHPKR